MVWAIPDSLATTTGIVSYFPFFAVLRCFSSRTCLQLPYIFRKRYWDMTLSGFPHSDTPGYNACLSAPRGFSQTATSFFGVLCLGIHRVPLLSFSQRNFKRNSCSEPEMTIHLWIWVVHCLPVVGTYQQLIDAIYHTKLLRLLSCEQLMPLIPLWGLKKPPQRATSTRVHQAMTLEGRPFQLCLGTHYAGSLL